MEAVYFSLGSNIQRRQNIRKAIARLAALVEDIVVSPLYRCPAVGFAGDDFYNLAVAARTDLGLGPLQSELKQIETQLGRQREGPKFSDRCIDIDILLYADYEGTFEGLTLPRQEILEYPFVLKPLADIAPQLIHPVARQPLQALWTAMATHGDPLQRIEGIEQRQVG